MNLAPVAIALVEKWGQHHHTSNILMLCLVFLMSNLQQITFGVSELCASPLQRQILWINAQRLVPWVWVWCVSYRNSSVWDWWSLAEKSNCWGSGNDWWCSVLHGMWIQVAYVCLSRQPQPQPFLAPTPFVTNNLLHYTILSTRVYWCCWLYICAFCSNFKGQLIILDEMQMLWQIIWE